MNVNDALGTDIAHVGDLVRTSSGDLGRISGIANLENALFHRLLTTPGSYIARPTYGVGILQYQNALSSLAKQQQLASRIREQFLEDPRVVDVLAVAINNNDASPELTIVNVNIKPVGYADFIVMTYQPFSQGI